MSNNILSVPLEHIHIDLGARMIPFGGWNMPVHYTTGILAEHHHTRSSVSLFDCSHMGQFRIFGPSASNDLDRMLPRLVSTQKHGTCRYNFLLTSTGTICDDIIVYRINDDEFFIVVNGGTIAKDAQAMTTMLSSDTTFIDESATTVKLDVQGPSSVDFLVDQGISAGDLPGYYRFKMMSVNGISCLVSRTGYTGELGFEFYTHKDHGEELWRYFTQNESIKPAGLGARDTLRLEVGYPLYGHELDEKTTPIEAGFGKMLNLDHEFACREALTSPPLKKLIALIFDSRRAVRADTELFTGENTRIGIVTSGSFSPSLKCSIALGYLNKDYMDIEDDIYVILGNKKIAGKLTKLPFYKNGSVRNTV